MISRIKEKALHWLRWSEKYTGTDMVYLASGGFWLTVGQIVASLSAFALSIIFANYLTPHVYGMYKYVLSLAGIAAIPTLAGVAIALQRAIAIGEDQAAHRALKIRLWGGVATALGAGAAATWYYLHGNMELGTALIIVALGTPLMEAYGLYDAILQGKGLYRKTTTAFVVSSIAATCAIVAAIFLTNGSLIALLTAYFGTWTIVRMLFWILTKPLLSNKEEAEPGAVAKYGFRLSLIGVVSVIAGQIDKIILFQFLGPVQLAVYAFATAMPEQLRAFLKTITPLALSRFSRRSAAEIQSSIHHKALISVLVALPLVGGYILIAPFVYQYLFPAYIDSVLPSQIFALSILVLPGFLYTAALQSQRAERILAANDITLNIVQILLLLVLIPLYGLWGAIVARVIGRFLGVIVVGYTVRFMR